VTRPVFLYQSKLEILAASWTPIPADRHKFRKSHILKPSGALIVHHFEIRWTQRSARVSISVAGLCYRCTQNNTRRWQTFKAHALSLVMVAWRLLLTVLTSNSSSAFCTQLQIALNFLTLATCRRASVFCVDGIWARPAGSLRLSSFRKKSSIALLPHNSAIYQAACKSYVVNGLEGCCRP
jgi:hypothetical protein